MLERKKMIETNAYKKAQGALLASAIGDALGWPNEVNSGNQNRPNRQGNSFSPWKRKNKNPFWHIETINGGEYSDDTQLTLAVARCLLSMDWKQQFTKVEYPFWTKYERGAGKAVKRAAFFWEKGNAPWKDNDYVKAYYAAGGNGGAMRILPHIIKNHNQDITITLGEVVENVILSHGHPRAILGATCYAYALDYLFRKQTKLEYLEIIDVLLETRNIWGAVPEDNIAEWLDFAKKNAGYDYALEWNKIYIRMVNMLEFIKKSLGSGLLSEDEYVLKYLGAYSEFAGAGDIGIVTAVYFFSKYVNTPELAISIPATSYGTDTDTIASMTGGLIGAFSGMDWIPLEWRSVQDYSYILDISAKLYGDARCGDELESTGIGRLEIISDEVISSKYSDIVISKCRTEFGQTIYLKKTLKKETRKNLVGEENKEQAIAIGLSDIEAMYMDEMLKRITLRKVLQILKLRLYGADENQISMEANVDIKTVDRLLEYFLKQI